MKQRDHYRQILGLVSRIGRLTNPQHMPALRERGVSLSQFLVLDVLAEAAESLRMTELAYAAGLSPSELTRVVSELETKGWAERHPAPDDSRARLVEATRAGVRLMRGVHTEATRELRGVWSDFTHDEWHGFIDHLQRFEGALRRVRASQARAASPKKTRKRT